MKKHILLHILIISFVFILTSVLLSAEEDKERLLVIPLKAKVGIDQEAVSILTDILYTEIIKLKMLTVLNRDDMKAILDKREFELAMGCDDNVCLLENVSKLSVSKVITGSIGVLGKRYIVILKLINKDGQTEVMEKDICDCPIEELTKSIEIISHKFLKYLGGESQNEYASIRVDSKPPKDKKYLDGDNLGTTPDVIRHIKPDRHEVEVKKDGYMNLNKTVNVNSGEELPLTVMFEKMDGAMIVDIEDPSPAKNAGFERGDIVIAYDNIRITNYNELINAVAQTEVGRKVEVDVLRKGKKETFTLKISKHEEGETKEWLGIALINLDQYVGEWKDGMMNGQGTINLANGEKYVGEWKDNKKHGQGTHTSPDGTKSIGEWKDGKMHGQGTYTSPDGATYVGEWKDNKKYGQGTTTWPNGAKSVGEWKDDKMHGQGTYTWPNGAMYVGGWKDDKTHGQGTHTRANGEKYVGEWKDDKKYGQGIYTWPNSAKYVGEWKDDKRGGQGTYTSPDGPKYVGEWKNGKKDGQGTIIWTNGTKYVGEWKDDMMNGQGRITWPNSEKYAGEWKDNKKYGQGTAIWPNGTKYVGEWKDNKRNGQGTITWPNNEKYVGEWKDNKRNGQGTITWLKGEKYVGEWKDDIAVGGWYYWASDKRRKWAYNDSQGKFHFDRKEPGWSIRKLLGSD